jgi:hypothetical protein
VRFPQLKIGSAIPVSDLDASRVFYEGTLGLEGEPAHGGHALRAGVPARVTGAR